MKREKSRTLSYGFFSNNVLSFLIFVLFIFSFGFTLPRLIFILFILNMIQFVIMGIMMFTKCPKREIASLMTYGGPYTGLPQLDLTANCSSHCECSNPFQPICGSDNHLYYSPCIAGCEVEDAALGMYTNCSCIPNQGEEKNNKWSVRLSIPILILVINHGLLKVIRVRLIHVRSSRVRSGQNRSG